MAALIRAHERALTLLFAELGGAAAEQGEAFIGTPGTLARRTNETGTQFWVHRFSDALGRRRETYLGKTDDPTVATTIDALRERITATNSAISRVRLLAHAGFATVDRKAFATLARLYNHGLFRAGALLIGSHAYAALLNSLGVRAVAHATEDMDIARREALALPGIPAFLDILQETGPEFFGGPALAQRVPSTSFAGPGGSHLRVDLRVPSRNDGYPVMPIPELQAHAEGLPYLAYLLGASQEVPALSTRGIVLVRTPTPERYAVHKLIVSQLRGKASREAEQDLRQAATLIEAVTERFPGVLEEALQAVPKSALRRLGRATQALARHLPSSSEAAWEAVEMGCAKQREHQWIRQ